MVYRVKYFYKYRHFFWSLVKKEIKVKYTQSVLGLSWMVLEPLLLVLTLSTIFTLIGRKSPYDAPFPIFFYAGVLPWQLYKSALVDGAGAFLKDKNLLKKIPFPREISVFKAWIVYFIEFLLSSVAFFVIMAIYQFPPNWHWFLIPGLILLQMFLSVGLMFLTASMNVYLRDIGILMKTLGSLWFWFTPVIFHFPYDGPTKYIYMLNPMAGIIDGYRAIIVENTIPRMHLLIPAVVITVILLTIGYAVFRKLEKGFVDVI